MVLCSIKSYLMRFLPFFIQIRDAPPIIPTDTNQGYKQMKAKIGQSRVRPWKWMPFTNPARKVSCTFLVILALMKR